MLHITDAKNGYYHIRLFGARILTIVCSRVAYIPMPVFLTLIGIGCTDFYETPRMLAVTLISKFVERYALKNLIFPRTKFLPLETALSELSYNKEKYTANILNIREKLERNGILSEIKSVAYKTIELAFTLPESLRDLPPIYHPKRPSTSPTHVISADINVASPIHNASPIRSTVEKKEPVKQVVTVPLPQTILPTNPFHADYVNSTSTLITIGEKRPRSSDDEVDDVDISGTSKRRKITNNEALSIITQLESQLTTAFFEIQKLKQLLNQ
ncbi:hypothetical protein F-LCD7_0268 [Faustovirus]|nr:hypothetical protein F-LCD7_0268 [Faustovirus]